jgi:hypothetical protein
MPGVVPSPSPGAAPSRSPDPLEARLAALDARIERLQAGTAARLSALELKFDVATDRLDRSLRAFRLACWLGSLLFAGIGLLAGTLLRLPPP